MHANKKIGQHALFQILYFYPFRPRSPFSKPNLLSYIVQKERDMAGCHPKTSHNHPYSKKKIQKNIRKDNKAKSKNIAVMLQ